MESLSRPPHRRKHSTTTSASSSFSSSSLKNPYDDVLFSSVGKTKFKFHEYAEIFSGPSSIPVLDLSGLDEPAGSADYRSSKLDYPNIFGRLRDDDVAIPYEELFTDGAPKKTETRIPADAQSHFQESGSLHSPGKMKKSSAEAFDQSADGVKPHINMSFNKISERNSDASNGKTHIAQLRDIPGFTYFVDGSQRLQKTEGDEPVSSLKREVSRTWSFSTGLDAVTANCGLSSEKPHMPSKSENLNKISKMPSPPVHMSDPNDNKDLRRSRLPSFTSKEFSEKAAAEQALPFSDEELDEDSVAAVSAAALKTAIEQAQESIRIAKMIMERKMEVLEDGSKPNPKDRSKVKGKDTRIGHEPGVAEEKSARQTHEVDPTLSTSTEIGGEFVPSLSNSNEFLNARSAEMGRVREIVGVAKDHGDALPEVGKEFAASCTQGETIHIAKKVEFGSVEVHLEATNFTRLVANTEHRSENSEHEEVDDKENLVCSSYKVESRRMEMETDNETLEQRESSIYQAKEPGIIAEMAKTAPKSSLRVEEVESVDEDLDQYQTTVDFEKAATNISGLPEGSPDCSQSTQERKTPHEAVDNLKISQEAILTEERDDLANDNGKHEEKFVEHEEMGYGEHLNSDFRNFLNESKTVTEKEILEQEDTEKSENVPAWEENGQHGKSGDEEENGMMQKEKCSRFGSEQELKEPVEEEISEREPKVTPEVEEAGKKVNAVHELEMNDETQNCGHDGLQKLPREYKPDEIADRNMGTSEFEAAQSIQMGADNYDEVLKGKLPGDAEETDRNGGRSEEDQDESEILETDSEEENDEAAVNAHNNNSGTDFSDTRSTDTSTVFSEAQEPCNVELNNKSEEHQAEVNSYEESDRSGKVTDTFSVIEDNEAGTAFNLVVNGMPRTASLRRWASDENLTGSTSKNTFEGLSSDSKTESIGLMDSDHEETLQTDEDMFETANQRHNAAPEYAAKINMQNLPEVCSSSIKVEEFDYTNVKPVPEKVPVSSEGSTSTSILENVDEASAHEAQACAENAKDNTSNKEEVGDGPDITSDDKEDVEEQREHIFSEDQSEGAYSQSNCEFSEEKGQNMEMNKENLRETPTMTQKDSKPNEQKFETDDPQQRIEAIKRGREREKDRMAVERAIREARERAFAEARERAERAAVEKAAAEARQRFMKEAREKLEKTSVETKQPVDKASTEVKLRAERAAVERATAEARERALEKAMSQRTSTESRAQGERHNSERVSSSSRNNGLKHSFSSSDLEKLDGTSGESAQRRKARLERHQRIMERAAKALAEKNMRDLLVQKEQAERNRLAESLDADIKRWAMGKEGNLRALLSTLQYILGSESGWQPISLTEIITTAAVRKAYRKATLSVHPDKLQQRGASIQQKYICEKVFDLLKAAWNRFNSEER